MRFYRILVAFLLCGLMQSCSSTIVSQKALNKGEKQRLHDALHRVFADSIMTGSQYGAKVQSMETGEVFYEHNGQMLFHPASNMKLLTTAAALKRLGVDYRFKTILAADSAAYTFGDTLLNGNLYLKGHGDPLFDLPDLVSMVDFLQASGVRRIEGAVIGDETYMDSVRLGMGWMWDDDPATFFPYLSALSLGRNVTQVIVSPGDSLGDTLNCRFVPYSPEFTLSNEGMTTDTLTENRLRVTRDWMSHRNHFTITGDYPREAGPDTTRLNVRNPGRFTLAVFANLISEAGIEIAEGYQMGELPADADTLRIHHSPPLTQVVYDVNKISDNLGAELILKTMAAEAADTTGDAGGGLSIIRQFLQEIGTDSTSYRIVDGSGASHYNLITVDMLIKVLDHMYRDFNLRPDFLTSLPIGGVDGTLQRRMLEGRAARNLRAKTGTVSGVSSLSGYVASADGEILAFSLMMQNFVGSSWPYRRIQDRVGEILAGFARRQN